MLGRWGIWVVRGTEQLQTAHGRIREQYYVFSVVSALSVILFALSYNDCDVGILPNQTYLNGTGPAAALNSPASKEQYDFALSWLPGQRLP